MEDPVVIVGISRTPIGAFMGILGKCSASELGAAAVLGAIVDSGIAPSSVDELIMGCVLPAGIGQAPARQVGLKAGLDESVPCTTVNKVCASGMRALEFAVQSVQLKKHEYLVAGGMESMSNTPHFQPNSRQGHRFGAIQLEDHLIFDGLLDAGSGKLMGELAEQSALVCGITREQQDDFSVASVARARLAVEGGYFQRELCSLASLGFDGEVLDEAPFKAKLEKIPHLKPVFSQNGTVTAANASALADGAAALVLTRESIAERDGLKVIAYVEYVVTHAQASESFALAPIEAIEKILRESACQVADVDLWEINEAFALVPLAAMQQLNIYHEKVNVHGGACALGHPLGATGARIIVSLAAALEKYEKKRGVASLCIGGGEAMAVMLRRP